MDNALPTGWVMKKLGEVCTKPQYGWTCSSARLGKTKYLRTTDISHGDIDWESVPFCSEEPDERTKYLVHTNDILVSRAGSVGVSRRVCRVPYPTVFASYLIRFTALAGAEPKYVEYFLRTPKYWDAIAEHSAGIAVPNVNATKLAQIELPLPPLPEQRRIVAKLEELLGKVEACQKRLGKIPTLLKRFRQAVLKAACEGRLTEEWRGEYDDDAEEPKGWRWVSVESLLPKGGIFDGPFGSNLKTADYTSSGVRVIRLENIGHLRFNADKLTYISPKKYESLRKHTVSQGDILFASFIDEEVRACLLPPLDGPAIAKADCFCLRPTHSVVDPTYLAYQLVSSESYSRLVSEIHGATRPRINTTQLRRLEIRLAPPAEQREIVRRVKALFSFADGIQERFELSRRSVNQLTQSILAKAFRGELVAQDRTK